MAFAASRHCPAIAAQLIGALGRFLAEDGPRHPNALIDRAATPGRSMGTLARTLDDFFVEARLSVPTDHDGQLAAGRRARRIESVPEPLRPAVQGFAGSMLTARERSRRAGTKPRSDSTVEGALATVRDFACFLVADRGKCDWALSTRFDVEAFLATRGASAPRALSVLQQFFRWARRHKVLLTDPAVGMRARKPGGITGATLTGEQQQRLFRRWTASGDVHPHEALTGLLSLLHAATSTEVRMLQVHHVDHASRAVQLDGRPLPTPLDPASWAAVERCLAHRSRLRTANPHVLVTKGTKTGRRAASTAYLSHVLDPAGVRPRILRTTRLCELVHTMDAKLVATVFGMAPEGVLAYLADHVDPQRLPERPSNPSGFGAT